MSENKHVVNKSNHFDRVKTYISSKKFKLILLQVLSSLILLAMFLASITPVRYQLTVGMVPTMTIIATKDVVDEVTTERNRREAADNVQPIYVYKEGVTDQVLNKLETIHNQMVSVLMYAQTLEDYSIDKKYTPDELSYASGILTAIELREFQLNSLLHISKENLDTLFTTLRDTIKNTMQSNVTQGQEVTAINSIMQIIGYKTDVNTLQNIAHPILRAVMMPNMIINEEATEKARAQAMEAVDDVVYKQGQNIVVKGEGRIKENQIRMLASLGLLSSDKTDYATYLGGILLFAAVILLMHMLLYRITKNMQHPGRYLLVIHLVMIVSYALCTIAKAIHLNYLAPLLLTGMLLSVTIGINASLVANLSLGILVAFGLSVGGQSTTSDIVYVLCSSLLAGSVCSILLKDNIQRARILLIGALGALMSFLVILGIGIMVSSTIAVVMPIALYSLGGSVLSVLLCLWLQPMLEWAFNLPTQSRLLDLCNPTQPLLHQLVTEAPGTYHHSLIIANLAEACAERIGANPLLARAGGYYHDIGKLKRPLYFKENQIGIGNVHDESSPAMSAAIITAHIRDGLAMAKQHRLPPELQDIISQHHGNSLVQYFYAKAQESGEEVNPEDYRYAGKPPESKEAAIVMLCDTVEAAIRTLKSPTKDDIKDFVLKLIQDKMKDRQLINSSLSVRDLHLIADTCANVLYGVFHERIEYPDQQRRKKTARELLGLSKSGQSTKEAK